MKKASIVFLQALIVFIGIGGLAFLIWEPQVEGVNAHATFSQIYFDPFILYAYTGSIAFFTALYQAFKVLGFVRENRTFSPAAAKSLRTIKYCAFTIIGFIAPLVAYLFIARPGDDIAGGAAMGLFIIFVSAITAAAAAMFEGIVQHEAQL